MLLRQIPASSRYLATRQGDYVTQYNSGVIQPAGIAINDEGNIFVTSYKNPAPVTGVLFNIGPTPSSTQNVYGHLCVLDSQHKVIHPPSIVTVQCSTGVAVDKDGAVYLCCYNNRQICKINTDNIANKWIILLIVNL